jgi:protease I
MAKVLMVIAAQGYQDIEYEDPKNVLIKAGHTVTTTSTSKKAYGGLGGQTEVDLLLDNVNEENFDAIVFVGGPGSHTYFTNITALNLSKKFFEKGKLTCAICAGPGTLANAGILKDKKATCWDGVSPILTEKGANYTGNSVEKDGNIITANGPGAAKKFGELIAKNL